MSIPKKIHYCWFGGGKMPAIAEKCIKSWKKFCPDFEIICWNEENFDISQNRYVKEAYEAKKWAFVTDYVRLWAVYNYGGIYFDTDVEVLKPIDLLLNERGFMGFDENSVVCTGLGFGAEAGNSVVYEILKDYNNISFVLEDGKYDLTPCPIRNSKVLEKMGMDLKVTNQKFMDVLFLPKEYMCPMEYNTGKKNITENTYTIHHYNASWLSPAAKRTTFIKRIIGVKLYDKLYGKFLYKFKWLEW